MGFLQGLANINNFALCLAYYTHSKQVSYKDGT